MRPEVDIALVRGDAIRDIAGQTQLSKSSVHRHKESHLSEAVINSKQALERTRGDVLASEAVAVLDKAVHLLERAEAAGDTRGAVAALRECRASIELISRLKPPKTFDDELTPSPLQMAELTEMAAQEFIGYPRLADQFAHELADVFFKLLKEYVPKLRPGAGERLVSRAHELDKEHGL
jgi:hypothetical protein